MSKLYYAPFVLGVPNSAPTDISLGVTGVSEGDPSGTTVGTLTTTDVDVGDTHTYTLVAGSGDTDNASFSIGGAGSDELLTEVAASSGEALDITGSPFSVRLRTTDNGSLFFEEQFDIGVNATGIYIVDDNFEGGGTEGWNSDMWQEIVGSASPGGFCVSDCLLTTEETAPPSGEGAGTWTLMQHWKGSPFYRPPWLRHNFDPKPNEGDTIEFEYWLKYHANFDWNDSFIKSIFIRSTLGNGVPIVIDSHDDPGGRMWVQTAVVGQKFSNIGGPAYILTPGDWVHHRWQIKISSEDAGAAVGFVHGWINDVQRWDYNDFYTNHVEAGKWTDIELQTTFNDDLGGTDQKRYWDLFKVRWL